MSLRPFLRSLLLLTSVVLPSLAGAQALQAPRPGIDYTVLTTPVPQFSGRGKIEVAEIFGYTCPHCAHFQPMVNSWKKTMPKDVKLVYVAAPFGGFWDSYAKAFYAAEGMGIQPRTHDNVFKALHIQGKLKTGDDNEAADVYAGLGIDRAKFVAAMNSPAVAAKMKRAKQFALRTGTSTTPTIVLAGKYRLNVTRDRGLQGVLSTLDYLLRTERAALNAAAGIKPTAAPAAAPAKP